MAWDPAHSPIILHAKALYENYAASIPVDFYFGTSWHWVNFGLAPCPVDNYIYCTYGIAVAVPILVLAGVVMAVVLWKINVLKRRNRIAAAIRRGLA
jgi:hypothetical protein